MKESPFSEIKKLLDPKVTTLEKLNKIDHRETSLGVVIPEILDFVVEPNPNYSKNIAKKKQMSLEGGSVVKTDILPWSFSYIFKCSKSCQKAHKMMCEEWELYELYRNCKKYEKEGKYKDENEVLEKVKLKCLNQMKEKKGLYFIVGTHYRFPTYFVISVVYSKKDDRF